MDAERWERVAELHRAALEREKSQRGAFLAEACAGDEELRREVESLLAQETQAASFLEKPAMDVAARALAEEVDPRLRGDDVCSSGDPRPGSHSRASGNPALRPGAMLSHYQIMEKLGAGGMGEVYRARDTKLNRDVALKFVNVGAGLAPPWAPQGAPLQALERFRREARMLAALNHSNIAAIYGLEEAGGAPALVMELVEGPTLADRLRPASVGAGLAPPSGKGAPRGAPTHAIPLDESLNLAKQIAEALEYAHERGIIHRDLKPANIKVKPDGTVKVLDFGLAKALDVGADSVRPGSPEAERSSALQDSPTISAMTEPGMIIGTAAYMSPEQASGKPVDRRTDIWAFGCVLYEMVTGKKAFAGESMSETLAAVLKTEPNWSLLPETTPVQIQRLVRRCLVKDPKQRLRDIGDARIAIEETLASGDSVAAVSDRRTDGKIGDQRSPLQRALPWALAAGIAAAMILAFVAAHYVLQPKTEQGVIQFSILPPENTTFAEFTLSPDGHRLAFVSTIAGTKRQLWVRPLNSLTPELLPGTEGASWPFWSADGRYLGFYAGGKLKKVEVSGGAPETLCDAAGVGATWSREGVIVFTNQWHLYSVPESGGAPALVAAADTARHETALLAPQFLPDGRHFLFFAGLGTLEGRTEVGSLDSKERQLLPNVPTNAQYAPPGYLLYLTEGTLTAGRFDTKRLRLTGESAPLAENVGAVLGPGYSKFSVSPSGVLAFQNGASRGASQMVWVDRKGKKLGTVGQVGLYTNPALSPDGTKLAVALLDPKLNTRDIWVYDLKRGTGSRLTFNPADDLNPIWSPDGNRIMFTSNRKGRRDIYQKPANGLGTTESVFESRDQSKSVNDWSPDGRYAMYDTTVSPSSLWTLPLFGERKPFAVVQGSFQASQAQFSPNGRFIAYTSEETGQSEVYVQTFPERGGKWQVSNSGGTEPMWRRDGKELFYLGADNNVMAVDLKTDSPQFIADIPKPLFEIQLIAGSWRNRYVVSPDGQRFLMTVPAGEAKPAPITVVLNWPALLKSSGK